MITVLLNFAIRFYRKLHRRCTCDIAVARHLCCPAKCGTIQPFTEVRALPVDLHLFDGHLQYALPWYCWTLQFAIWPQARFPTNNGALAEWLVSESNTKWLPDKIIRMPNLLQSSLKIKPSTNGGSWSCCFKRRVATKGIKRTMQSSRKI